VAYLFDAAGERITTTAPVVTGKPLSLFCLFRSTTVITNQVPISLAKASDNSIYFALELRADVGGDPIGAVKRGTTFVVAETTTGYSVDTWHTGLATFSSGDGFACYLDGGSKGTNTNTDAPSTDRLVIGLLGRLNLDNRMQGDIAEVAVWNDELNDAEAAMMTVGGASPAFVRPQNLVHHLHLIRDIVDLRSSVTWSTTNSPTVSNHPSVILPARPAFVVVPTAAADAVGPANQLGGTYISQPSKRRIEVVSY